MRKLISSFFFLVAALVMPDSAQAQQVDVTKHPVISHLLIPIQGWNMRDVGNITLPPANFNINNNKIIDISAVIYNDANSAVDKLYRLNSDPSAPSWGGNVDVIWNGNGTITVKLMRMSPGKFVNNAYVNPSVLRGYVNIAYFVP
jgi:hypothetical protein